MTICALKSMFALEILFLIRFLSCSNIITELWIFIYYFSTGKQTRNFKKINKFVSVFEGNPWKKRVCRRLFYFKYKFHIFFKNYTKFFFKCSEILKFVIYSLYLFFMIISFSMFFKFLKDFGLFYCVGFFQIMNGLFLYA